MLPRSRQGAVTTRTPPTGPQRPPGSPLDATTAAPTPTPTAVVLAAPPKVGVKAPRPGRLVMTIAGIPAGRAIVLTIDPRRGPARTVRLLASGSADRPCRRRPAGRPRTVDRSRRRLPHRAGHRAGPRAPSPGAAGRLQPGAGRPAHL
ncbi:hypothetical protein G5V59_27350 [Nocardioides sp. W3-2-3]|uniref:hypothetical protein n=1 Tax=Nocardioides convexus TaxID=2712224 RepID=UPI00241889AD|nr:hypothetical protein [Nocardioides convexus]NHA02099.1 hypothetical protein [Nocardioides convexus]